MKLDDPKEKDDERPGILKQRHEQPPEINFTETPPKEPEREPCAEDTFRLHKLMADQLERQIREEDLREIPLKLSAGQRIQFPDKSQGIVEMRPEPLEESPYTYNPRFFEHQPLSRGDFESINIRGLQFCFFCGLWGPAEQWVAHVKDKHKGQMWDQNEPDQCDD